MFIGSLTDAAYFNQLSAVNGAITHSGDCKNGTTSEVTNPTNPTNPTNLIVAYVLMYVVFCDTEYPC